MDKQLKQLREAYKSLELLTERSYGIEFHDKLEDSIGTHVAYLFNSWVPYKVNKTLEYILRYDLDIPYGDYRRAKLDIEFDIHGSQFGLIRLSFINGVDARNVLDTVLEGLEATLKMIYSDHGIEELMIKVEALKEDSEYRDSEYGINSNKRLSLYTKYIERSGVSGWVINEVDVDGDDIRIWISRERE